VAANHHTTPIDFGCESAENWQLSSASTIAIVIIKARGKSASIFERVGAASGDNYEGVFSESCCRNSAAISQSDSTEVPMLPPGLH